MIKQVRLDERLIHGEVTTKWMSHLKVSHIVVVNDKMANDKFQANLLKMSIPENYKCLILTVERAIAILNDERCEKMSIFVVVQNPQDLLTLIEHVPTIQEVNIANFGYLIKADVPNKTVINRCLSLDDDDIRCLRIVQEKVKNNYHQVLSDTQKINLKI